jgi:hypothetical protein
MKKSPFRLLASAVCVLALAALSVAQSIPKVPYLGVTESGTFLLTVPNVQREIKFTPEQQALLAAVIGKYSSAQSEVYSRWTDETTDAQADVFAKQLEDADRQFAAGALKILTPEQETRLEQVSLQLYGIDALGKEEIAKKVGLSGEQLAKARAIAQMVAKKMEDYEAAFGAKIENLPLPKPGDPASERAYDRAVNEAIESLRPLDLEVRKVREKAEADLLALLNPAQRKTWESMLGPKFAVQTPLTAPRR